MVHAPENAVGAGNRNLAPSESPPFCLIQALVSQHREHALYLDIAPLLVTQAADNQCGLVRR